MIRSVLIVLSFCCAPLLDLVALHSLLSWRFVIVVWLFLAAAVPWAIRLQFVIVVFPDHTHYFVRCQHRDLYHVFFSFCDFLYIYCQYMPLKLKKKHDASPCGCQHKKKDMTNRCVDDKPNTV